jgi:hypothetical protein
VKKHNTVRARRRDYKPGTDVVLACPDANWCAVRKIIVLKIGYASHAINAWFGAADALMPRSLRSRARLQ